MDVKLIIRELLAKGMSEEEIKRNLDDLGVENADELIAQATAQPPSQSSAQSPQPKPQPQNLFQQQSSPTQQSQPEEVEKPEIEEIQKPYQKQVKQNIESIKITSISSEGEKEITVGTPSTEEPKPDKLFTPVSKTKLSSTDDLEEKLDDIISLLKALQDINKKVLETDREVLLRLKT